MQYLERYNFWCGAELSAEEKAELKAKGHEVDYEQLKQEIEQRDYNDKNRDFSPLVQAEDAIYIDTTKMNIEQVCAKVLSYVEKR